MVKGLLDGVNQPYEERNIETDQEAFKQAAAYQFKTMPQVVIGGVIIGGYEATHSYLSNPVKE